MSYCTQTDLELRLGTSQLAQLSNEQGNATSADANVITAIITQISSLIDSSVSQVYQIPLALTSASTVALINTLAVDMASYYLYLRRVGIADVPASYQNAYKQATTILQQIADQVNPLAGETVIAPETSLTSNNKMFDFNNTDSPASLY